MLQAGSRGVGVEPDVPLAETEADRVLLRLFQAALKSNRLLFAYELASRLHNMRSLEGSLKLANHHQCAALPPLTYYIFPRVLCLFMECQSTMRTGGRSQRPLPQGARTILALFVGVILEQGGELRGFYDEELRQAEAVLVLLSGSGPTCYLLCCSSTGIVSFASRVSEICCLLKQQPPQ